MSQSTSWVEGVIFACAPLGIITAMVGAIRVGGATWMKAVVGRARESEGVVEVELMSSTSDDVCELWNGHGVIRVLGSSPIIELYYLGPQFTNNPNASSDTGGVPLIELREGVEIHDFESAKADPQQWLTPDSSGPGQGNAASDSSGPGLENATSDLVHVPNIGLNLSEQLVSRLEFWAVAIVGVLLQLGVVVFAGVSVHPPARKQNFEKDGRSVQTPAFPLMAAGTGALVIGMFMCCHIVDQRTTEATWYIEKPNGYRVMVSWLQKGGEVNDQQFKSFILSRATESSKIWSAMPEFVKNLLHTDTRPLIRTSHRNSGNQATLTAIAVSISLAGFVVQFVGLRGLSWHVTIAQLVATGIMTFLRALIRRNLVYNPKSVEIERGYELEDMAKKITDCGHWSVTTWKPHSDENPSAAENSPDDGCRLAKDVMDARQRLGKLSRWPSQWQKTVNSVTEAMETTMDFLWTTNPDLQLKTGRPSDKLEWELFVEVSRSSEEPARPNGGAFSASVRLMMARNTTANGTWGRWKASRNEIEAVMGLWTCQLSKSTPKYRIVGRGDPLDEESYKLWLLPQTQLMTISEHSVGGPPGSNGPERLVAVSETPLESICGQLIFSTFMSNVVDQAIESVAGKVRVRAGEQGVKASFGLRNTVLDELVNRVERSGLAFTEDAFLSIVPIFGKLPKHSATTEAFSDLAIEISTYTEAGQFEHAESLLLWLFDAAELEIKAHEGKNEWKEAGKTYLLLFKTYYHVEREDYVRNAEEAMGMFCKRFLRHRRTGGAPQNQHELLKTVFSNDWEESSMLTRLRENLGRWSVIQLSDEERYEPL